MAEYPEICQLASQMNEMLTGKRFEEVDIYQEKCINMDTERFRSILNSRQIIRIDNIGKWIHIQLDNNWNLMISLGMGADIIYFDNNTIRSDNYQCKFKFEWGTGFTCRFWWFGHVNLIESEELLSSTVYSKIGLSPLDSNFTFDYFYNNLKDKSARIKNVILGQKVVSGIGNAYIHDILYVCKIHPCTPCNLIDKEAYQQLYYEIVQQMKHVMSKKGLHYEKDFFGQYGGYRSEDFIIAYKEGTRCFKCGSEITKIKTGSTSSYICPGCQRILS